MKLEHFALNVEDPIAMADWYVRHIGLNIVKQMSKPPYTAFLADSSGNIMIEIYKNPADKIPPYRDMDPLLVHLAFVSVKPDEDKKYLLASGASLESEQHLDDGSHLVMLRDPWGLSIQLCKRGIPMLKETEFSVLSNKPYINL